MSMSAGWSLLPIFSTKKIAMLTAMAMARKKTLLIALGKVNSLTPLKMRLQAMKKEEKALKMSHKMMRMKKRALVMKLLQIIQMKVKRVRTTLKILTKRGIKTKRRMDSQMRTKIHQISRKKTMRTMKREIHKRNNLLTIRRKKVTRAKKMQTLLVMMTMMMTMNVRTMKPLDGERRIEAVHGLHPDPKRR